MANNNYLSTIINVAVDPEKTKYDVVDTLRQMIDNNTDLKSVFNGTISEEDMSAIKLASRNIEDDKDVNYVKDGDNIEVHPLTKSKKMVNLFVKEASKEEARYFTDLYYQEQASRMRVANQIGAIDRGKDQADSTHKVEENKPIDTELTMTYRHYILNQKLIIENDIKGCLSDYSDRMNMGKYAKAIKGIGPVFASVLCSYLDIPDKETLPPDRQNYTVGNWISFAGLNDNNRPWLSDAQAKAYLEEAIEENNGVINEDTVRSLCAKTRWTYDHYYEFCSDKKTGKFKGFTKDKLISASKLVPYNKNLKKTMYLIGQSFIKVQNKSDSLYGKLYKERLEYEINRNERGGNEEYCRKNIGKLKDKNTETYKCYSKGKIPKSQCIMRAQRHTVKILLNHLFCFAWMEKYQELAPLPYVFAVDGCHQDIIPPEVDFFKYLPEDTVKKIKDQIANLDNSDNSKLLKASVGM